MKATFSPTIQKLAKFCAVASMSVLALTQCIPAEADDPSEAYLGAYDTKLDNSGSFRKNGYWDGDDLKGRAQIRISLSEQLAFFYKGQQLAGVSPISSGMGGWDTPTGLFRVTQKNKDHTSSLYGVIVNRSSNALINDDADSRVDIPGPGEVFKGAPMKYFMRFNGAVGMHTGHIPGYRASHGCVRLPDHMAKKFFENAPLGTPVKVDP